MEDSRGKKEEVQAKGGGWIPMISRHIREAKSKMNDERESSLFVDN